MCIPLLFFAPMFMFGSFSSRMKMFDPLISVFAIEHITYVPHPQMSGGRNSEPLPDILTVGFTPNNNNTQSIMRQTRIKWMEASHNNMTLLPFESDGDMESHFYGLQSNDASFEKKFVGVVFNDANVSSLNYTLRGSYNDLPGTAPPYIADKRFKSDFCRIKQRGKYDPIDNDAAGQQKTPSGCDAVAYARSGVLALQTHLSAAYTELCSSSKVRPVQLLTRMMPQLDSVSVEGGEIIAAQPAFCMTIILGTFICFLVSSAVAEKEARLLAHMQVMGLRSSVYWMGWTFLYFVVILAASVICVLMAKLLGIWPHSNLFLIIIHCVLYASSMIAFCWCIVPLVRRPSVASVLVFIVIFAGAFMVTLDATTIMTTGDKWGLGFFPSAIFTIGLTWVTKAELLGFGTDFDNFLPKTGYSFGSSIFSLLTDVIVFGLCAVYLEQVFPSDNRPKQLPWFFVLPSYWVKPQSTTPASSTPYSSADIESVTPELEQKVAVSSRHLRKDFYNKAGAAAVEDFTYEIYEDEVLAVLGHNGAGKTTLINMLVGFLKPTSGSALIYGQDITNPQQLKTAQTSIGICPQNDILFDPLTVKEHIVFYARLKGFSNSDAEFEYQRIIDCVGMREQADNKSRTLSGGQKRRLSLAIAIVGNPRVLLLDEPTSGVDPFSRSLIWHMIRGFKKGRCVIVTTHSMQEADIHCDRKLIFSHGRIRCAGSSLFLKNRFGAGYHLTMAVEKEFNETEVAEFVAFRVLDAKVSRVHGGEMSFILPKDAASSFPKLFNDLDRYLTTLKVRSYGIADTSLEEIFLKLADSVLYNAPTSLAKSTPQTNSRDAKKHPAQSVQPKKGVVSHRAKFLKLCKIRFLLAMRSKVFWISHFVLPLLLLIFVGVLLNDQKRANARMGTSDRLTMRQIGAALKDTGIHLASNHSARKNPLVAIMEDIAGVKFDEASYSQLSQTAPHLMSMEFLESTALAGGQQKITAVDNRSVSLPVMLVYNSSATHGLPFAANLLLNAIFRTVTGRAETFDLSIKAFPDPKLRDKEVTGGLGWTLESIFVGFTLLLIPGIYCVDVCRDRILKIRSQVRMTSCPMWLYWTSVFISHIVQYIGTFALTVILMYVFDITDFTENIAAITVLFLFHATAVIIFCYCVSFAFRKHTTAMVAIPFPLALAGIIAHFICLFLRTAIEESHRTQKHPEMLVYSDPSHQLCVFLFPFYGFYAGLFKLDQLRLRNRDAERAGFPHLTAFDWNSDLPIILVAHFAQVAVLLPLLWFLESMYFNQTWFHTIGLKSNPFSTINPKRPRSVCATKIKSGLERLVTETDEEDVLKELHHAENIDENDGNLYTVLTQNLSKSYGGSRLCHRRGAVKNVVCNVSLLVPTGEILGLLGPNGAGKSTTLSMIAGEVNPTSGNIYLRGLNMRNDPTAAVGSMGSCPQTDTLWDDINMSEHLELYATLNDFPEDQVKSSVSYFVDGLDINEHVAKNASALSGGTKRKVTFAISMLGGRPLVLLDEPSTGMDPQSKRFLWNVIIQNFGSDRSAILTTHSMEEADALCSRICIILNGTVRCIGSSQHLKDKYGTGYVLELRLNISQTTVFSRDPTTSKGFPDQTSFQSNHGANAASDQPPIVSTTETAQHKAKLEVLKLFPKANCTEQQYNRMVFTITKDQVSALGTVFAELDKLKHSLDLEEYSFSQTTLEQVFLHFAAMQEG